MAEMSIEKPPMTSLSPEMLVPRLGEYLVQNGSITNAQLVQALEIQSVRQKKEKPYLLGTALLELGYIDRRILDHAITEQIILLRNALEDANRNLENRVRARTLELQEALWKLSELDQMKANFVANISHELRTPLTHIKGYMELLAAESLGPINGEQKDAISVSQRSVDRLASLVESLIAFSLASHGEMNLRITPLDLDKVIAEVVANSRVKAVDRGVILQMELDHELPPIKADSEKISWVILQLLDNAIKFTPTGGQVTVSVRVETHHLVKVSVTDTGIGIPRERLSEIFEPFHQLDGSSTRRVGGTGMGLTLVREILKAHGSVIEVESENGKGSTFRFPLMTAEETT